MYKLKYFGVLLLLLILVQGCKTKRSPSIKDKDVADSNTLFIWDKVNESNVDFEWFYAKANASVSFENMSFGGKADIRIKKDEKILMSIKKFGFEIARALFTPDSVFMINRLEGSYMAMSFDSIQSTFDVPFSFDELQQMTVGNNITKGQKALSSMNNGNGYTLKTRGDDVDIVYLLNDEYRIQKTSLKDDLGRSFEVEMDKYKHFGSESEMASRRSYYYPTASNPEYKLNFELEKVEFNKPKKMKFEIPSRYKEM